MKKLFLTLCLTLLAAGLAHADYDGAKFIGCWQTESGKKLDVRRYQNNLSHFRVRAVTDSGTVWTKKARLNSDHSALVDIKTGKVLVRRGGAGNPEVYELEQRANPCL